MLVIMKKGFYVISLRFKTINLDKIKISDDKSFRISK